MWDGFQRGRRPTTPPRTSLFKKRKNFFTTIIRVHSSPPDRNFIVILLLYFGQHIKNFLRDLERGRVPVWNEGRKKAVVLKFAVGDRKGQL